MFYRFEPRSDGLVDIWLTPGDTVPYWKLDGRMDFRIRVLAVMGIDPRDPHWDGSLEEHVRAHYCEWLEMAEVIEI